jgi:hypothetical protein
MKTTARFDILRKKTLKNLFTIKNLSKIWRSVVRSQMRQLDILDLHDYYDFNLNIEDRSREIRIQILKGQYKASPPLIYRLEKKYGICRHLMIPSPSDALIFQTITEYLAPLVKEATPTEKAYYSRDKHLLKLPHEFDEGSGYPWFILWPRFQKEIFRFSNKCDFLVITDVTNFFDNIGLRELRHIVSSRIKAEEVILDLLFNIIEQLSWVPDYLPSSLKGLPTINLEAFRILPHMMLFEVDEVLNDHTNGNFVRWMDDIDFGVNSKDKAYQILSNINDVLKSRGLALNLAKTKIYTSLEAQNHFLFDENKYLNEFHKKKLKDRRLKKYKAEFIKRFRSHLTKIDLRNWDRVTKRYLRIGGEFNISQLRRYCSKLFKEQPGIRPNILRYLSMLGFSKSTSDLILSIINETKRYDDVTLFQFVKIITEMKVPRNKIGHNFIKEFRNILSKTHLNFGLYCRLWFGAKYDKPHQLLNLINNSRTQWVNEQFLARQIVSILPRIYNIDRDETNHIIEDQLKSGPRDAASVASNIQNLFSVERLDKRLSSYLFPEKIQKPYPLSKFLTLLAVLSSKKLSNTYRNKIDIRKYIDDPWFLHWIDECDLYN